MQLAKILTPSVLALLLSGCQCCNLTERYQDKIDLIADRRPHLDHLYNPAWDLTRIGDPDWCSNPVNRWIYGDCCCRDTRRPPGYVHNPMYVPPARSNVTAPIPGGEYITPRLDTGPDEQGTEPVPTQISPLRDSKELEQGTGLPPLPGLELAP